MATHLIVQGLEVETADLKALAKLTVPRVSSRSRRTRSGWSGHARKRPRRPIARARASTARSCRRPEARPFPTRGHGHGLDPDHDRDHRRDRRHAGLKGRVAEITAAAMRGEIDYAASLRERAALLEGLDEGALRRVYEERLRLSPGAERLVAALRHLGIRTLLVSGGFTYFTDRLQLRLAIDETCSNTLEIRDGRLTGRVVGDIVDAAGKRAALDGPAARSASPASRSSASATAPTTSSSSRRPACRWPITPSRWCARARPTRSITSARRNSQSLRLSWSAAREA